MGLQKKRWSKNKTSSIKQLHKKKFRTETGLFLAEGMRGVEQILANKKVQLKEIICTEVTQYQVDAWLVEQSLDLPGYCLTNKEFADISTTETPPGVMAVCEIPDLVTEDFVLEQTGVVVALDAIQDPGNLGAILRSCVWFGVDTLILGKGTVDPYNPKVVRSTVGATGAVNIHYADLPDFFTKAESNNWNIHLLDGGEQANNLKKAPNLEQGKHIVVLGNEANGVNPALFGKDRQVWAIGGSEQNLVESLNASVALSIALFHYKK